MLWNSLVPLLISTCKAAISQVNIPGVGPINGLILQTPNTKTPYYQYLGIPYGKAGRFEVSQLADPWTTPRDCTVEGYVCPQPTGDVQYPGGISEDCLVLTVTTPINPSQPITALLPVLVFFYGGAFIIGTSRKDTYDPQYLVQEGVVIVQPNYRLGAFGWVTDGNIIPRNLALKDARTALRWVQRFIQYFGGDPNLVTIYGESAGSVLVSSLWHANERLPANLFRSVFMQSGQVIAPWALQKNPQAAYMNVLTKTTCISTVNDPQEVQVACLKSLPYQDLEIEDLLTLGLNDLITTGVTRALNAAVVMEDPSDPDALLIAEPLQQLKRGNIWTNKPLLISNTNYEMLSFSPLADIFRGRTNEQVVPGGMQPVNPNLVGSIIKSHYAGYEALWAAQLETTYIQFANDVAMYFPQRYFIELVQPKQTSTTPMYVLEFAYASPMGRLNDQLHDLVGHADDLIYSWKLESITQEDVVGPTYPSETWLKRAQFNRMICNFVKYNNPTVGSDPLLNGINWPAVTDLSTVNYLHFDHDLTIRQRPEDTNFAFWHRMYDQYATGTISL